MSLRSAGLVIALILGTAAGCGGGGGGKAGKSSAKEPTTAKEKQLLEAKASGEVDGPGQTGWGKWRYTGDRNNCFFVAGNKCFKTQAGACGAMRCKKGQKCKAAGTGPATVSCVK
jgi:hypothetical protein